MTPTPVPKIFAEHRRFARLARAAARQQNRADAATFLLD